MGIYLIFKIWPLEVSYLYIGEWRNRVASSATQLCGVIKKRVAGQPENARLQKSE